MPSTFFGLNIAFSGLNAASVAQNTTANNISNSTTKGYSKQTVTQEAYDALRTFTTYGCAGAGVDTIAIERSRNEFYDEKYWSNNSDLGEYDKKQYYMELIENYFSDEAAKTPGFTTIFNNMYNALQDVIKNAGSTSTKTSFIGMAESLTDYFNTVAGNLQKVQADANSEIKVQVNSINSIAAQIATLNKQINTIELTGSTANELRDKRDLLIDQLSTVVDVDVKETPIYDTQDPTRVTGATRYVVTIGAGQTLVDMDSYNELECVARTDDDKINQSDIDGLYDVVWAKSGAEFNLNNSSMGGTLRGLIDIRDGNNNTNFGGTVTGVGTTGGATPKQTVTVEVTADYLQDLNKCTLPDNGVIKFGNKEFAYDSWTFNRTVTDATTTPPTYSYSYTFTLDENTQKASASLINKEAEVGDSINYKGVPYYMEQMNEWVRSFATAFNNILTQDGSVDGYGDAATNLFTATSNTTTSGQAELTTKYDGDGAVTVNSTDDSYYRVTALNFEVSKSMIKDSNKLATHTTSSDGQDKYDVLEDLIDLKTDKSTMSFRGGSSSTFLESILSDIALGASKANTGYLNFTNMKNAIANQRLSVSGVDEDEEALDLVKYQNAYTLASKMVSTLTECYDRLILSTGV